MGVIADQLTAALRELAQSDERMMRALEEHTIKVLKITEEMKREIEPTE
tara:strand:+ start:128 stop:274 length:147 start_codon:yes stop_codon:yes gene_type:complete